jgi:hypothetical protein
LKAAVYLVEETQGNEPDTEEKVEVKAEAINELDTEDKSPVGEEEAVKDTDVGPTETKPEAVSERPSRRSRGSRGNGEQRELSNDEKLKIYKKQSEERLLDIKRSREAKIGKKRAR